MEAGARIPIFDKPRSLTPLPGIPKVVTAGLEPGRGPPTAAMSRTNSAERRPAANSSTGQEPPDRQRADYNNLRCRTAKRLEEDGEGPFQCCNCGEEVFYSENMFVCPAVSAEQEEPCEHIVCEPCVAELSGDGSRIVVCDCSHVLDEHDDPLIMPILDEGSAHHTHRPSAF